VQGLDLTVDNEGDTVLVSLGHITALQNLGLYVNCSAAAGSSLPTSLTVLTLHIDEVADTSDNVQHWGVSSLQQLELGSWLQHPEALMSLREMTTLTFLDNCHLTQHARLVVRVLSRCLI
jgi:hypothetical protein